MALPKYLEVRFTGIIVAKGTLDLPSSLAKATVVLGSPRTAKVKLGAIPTARPGREIVDRIIAVDGGLPIR